MSFHVTRHERQAGARESHMLLRKSSCDHNIWYSQLIPSGARAPSLVGLAWTLQPAPPAPPGGVNCYATTLSEKHAGLGAAWVDPRRAWGGPPAPRHGAAGASRPQTLGLDPSGSKPWAATAIRLAGDRLLGAWVRTLFRDTGVKRWRLRPPRPPGLGGPAVAEGMGRRVAPTRA